jgi:hypothetical protein
VEEAVDLMAEGSASSTNELASEGRAEDRRRQGTFGKVTLLMMEGSIEEDIKAIRVEVRAIRTTISMVSIGIFRASAMSSKVLRPILFRVREVVIFVETMGTMGTGDLLIRGTRMGRLVAVRTEVVTAAEAEGVTLHRRQLTKTKILRREKRQRSRRRLWRAKLQWQQCNSTFRRLLGLSWSRLAPTRSGRRPSVLAALAWGQKKAQQGQPTKPRGRKRWPIS